jgi:hypothetical protein
MVRSDVFDFTFVVQFEQNIELQLAGYLGEPKAFGFGDGCRYQQNSIGAMQLCFVNLILVHDKVFAQYRNITF